MYYNLTVPLIDMTTTIEEMSSIMHIKVNRKINKINK